MRDFRRGFRGCLAALLLLLSACSLIPRGRPPCPIRIGVVADKNVTDKELAALIEIDSNTAQLLGYRLAVAEINEKGGVLGCPLELVEQYDEASPHKAQLAVQNLLENQTGVLTLVGARSSQTTPAAVSIAEVYQIPFVVPTATSPLITTQGYQWVFRINASSSEYMEAVMAFIQRLKTMPNPVDIQTIAIVYSDTEFGNTTAVAAVDMSSEYGIRVVGYETYDPNSPADANVMYRIMERAGNPDVLLFVVSSSSGDAGAQLMRQCKAIGMNPKLYVAAGGDFIRPGILAVAEAEFVVSANQWTEKAAWEGVLDFVLRFKQRYGDLMPRLEGPLTDPPLESAEAYISIYVIKDALERVGQAYEPQRKFLFWTWNTGTKPILDWSDTREVRRVLRDALRTTRLSNSMFGPIQFDDTGQNQHPVVLTQIFNDEFYIVYPPQFKTATNAIAPVPVWTQRWWAQ